MEIQARGMEDETLEMGLPIEAKAFCLDLSRKQNPNMEKFAEKRLEGA